MHTSSLIAGIRIRGAWPAHQQAAWSAWLMELGLSNRVLQDAGVDTQGPWLRFRLSLQGEDESDPQCPFPDFDTSGLARTLHLKPDESDRDLDAEILAALLLAPTAFEFPSLDECMSAVRVRRHIVQTGRRTLLSFDTENAERPDCWSWSEATGFILKPGHDLIASLEQTLWPDLSGHRHSFSCYRATEYVLLLALAKELQVSHPAALQALQAQWQVKAIQSGAFHDVFLHEYGSLQAPVPVRYYVPGGRLWFRNPHEASACVEGYEGSWVFYLGQGLFTNFWKPDQPYTLLSKCVELFHWRDGLRETGEHPWIDEALVEERVAATLADTRATQQILQRMMQLRDPAGVYGEGGCIDASREAVRCVHPRTWSLGLPLPTQ